VEGYIKVGGNITKTINFAMQQNYVPIVRNLVIYNESQENVSNIDVKISFEPDFAKEFVYNVAEIKAGSSVEIAPVRISLKSEFLFSLTEKMVGTINIKVVQGENVLFSEDNSIELLALNEWSGLLVMPEIIASFVTPNHPAISTIIKDAAEVLNGWTSNPSFTGYQTRNANNVKLQMAAIYEAIKKQNIIYNNPPASYETVGQRIRLPHTVLEDKQGTCIDLAVLYASCIEAVGLHPLLVFNKTHAYIGCWLEEETFADCMIDDISALEKRVAEGAELILLAECTDMVYGKTVDFDLSLKHGKDHLLKSDEFECIIDIQRSRGSGIRPIPLTYKKEEIADANTLESEEGWVNYVAPSTLDNSLLSRVAKSDEPITKQKIWERKLLDFSLRNTLLNFRVNKNAFQIMTADLGQLEDMLSDGKEFRVMEAPIEWTVTLKDSKIFEIENEKDLIKNIATEEFKSFRIRTFLDSMELEKNLKGLYRAAKVSMEENGSNTLFLALGFLRWYETDVAEKARYAPLVLVPVEIVRSLKHKGYVIRSRQEDAQINVTLLEYLRQDYGVDISGLDPLPEDEHGIDLPLVYNTIRQGIMAKKRWNIEEMAFVGLFSFGQFVMWNDIRNRADELKSNKVVNSLINGALSFEPLENMLTAEELDEKLDMKKMAVPMAADSSQLVAIAQAAAGQSFVLHGPPGTGKSQTITNMIANALYNGKSVLFVAEKQAALSVVQKRLAKIGLDPFCLELHSNKTNKSSVLSELNKALEVGRIKSPEEYEQTADKLAELKNELNYIIEAIHQKRDYGSSLYEAIEMFEKNVDKKDKVVFAKEGIENITKEKIASWDEIIRQYGVAIEEIGEYAYHPLVGYEGKEYSIELRGELQNDLNNALSQIDDISKELDIIFNWAGVSHKNRPMIEDLMEAVDVSYDKAIVLNDVLGSKNYEGLIGHIETLINTGNAYKVECNELGNQFENAVFDYNVENAKLMWKQADTSWFIPKFFGQKKLVKEMKMYAKVPGNINKSNILSIYDKLSSVNDKKKEILLTPAEVSGALSGQFLGLSSDWNNLLMALNKTKAIHEIVSAMPDEDKTAILIATDKVQTDSALSECKEKVAAYISLIDTLKTKYIIDMNKIDSNVEWISAVKHTLSNYVNNISELRNKVTFNQINEKLCNEGLTNVSEAYKNGVISAADLMASYSSNLYYALALHTIAKDERLADFNGKQYNDMIVHYKEIIDKYQKLTVQELVARLSANVPANNTASAASSELGILKKAIKNNGRMLPLRKLFEQIPTLLRRLCPCMLMSPISVAQYIDPSFPKFDLVIFDEASQLPTSTAVGTIARGENVVIVGDPKQLPPTSFFSANVVDEENMEQEDLESLLDDCLAISMPQEHLKWHYRSRHESLIAYSNMKYYDNKLYTFPSPRDLVSEVKMVHLDGFYDKGKSKQNRAEAEAIVAEIIRRLQDDELKNDSIGVVTFSSVQQNLIDDLLYEEFKKYPELEEFDRASKEPIFIKNLENVQGDERDVILFSVGYGPDKDGKVSMNFGPLNRDGGWRRLNVAISRSRKSMIVYSVLRPEQIDLSRTRSEGVEGLKGFLEFAERGKNMLASRVNNNSKAKDYLIEEIANEILNMGYDVKCNIGCSEYKMDIGVVNPKNKDTYILGILIDGENCKETATASDRFVSQTGVLEGLGWSVMRIWTLDWLDDPERVKRDIKIAIENVPEKPAMADGANAGTDVKNEPMKAEKVEQVPENVTVIGGMEFEKIEETQILLENKKNYVSADIAVQGATDEFYEEAAFPKLVAVAKDIVDTEAPISRKYLMKKLYAAWEITRGGARVDGIFAKVMKELDIKFTGDDDRIFVWKSEQIPEEYNEYRVEDSNGIKRSMDDVPSEEIINAMKEVLNEQISLSQADLIKETAKKFGYLRLGSVIDTVIQFAINKALEQGLMGKNDNGNIILK